MQLDQRAYWDSVATEKTFSHPLRKEFLDATALQKDAALLDIGCGYGRTLEALWERGYSQLTGLDFSARMLCFIKSYEASAPCLI